jgi:hypothetical protein
MSVNVPGNALDERPQGTRSFFIALALYGLAFALPVGGGEWGGGLDLFLLGAWFTLWTLLCFCTELLVGGLARFSPRDTECFLLLACWLANPVFWYALWQSARGREGRALGASFLAVGLASIVGFLAVAKRSPNHEFFGPAYIAWLSSMVWLYGARLLRRVRA